MTKKEIRIISLAIGLFILTLLHIFGISAEVQTLGTKKLNECINLTQICANCSFVNITSISSPNSTILVNNVAMIKAGTLYSYNFCKANQTGFFIVNGIGDLDGIVTVWAYDFEVTPSGKELSPVQISIYIFFFIICILMVLFSSKLLINNKLSKDEIKGQELYEMKKRNEFYYYLTLLKKKMWIVGLFGVYLSLLIFFVILNQLVYNLGLTELNDLFINISIIMSWGLIPFTLFWFVYIIILFYKSTAETMKYQFGSIGKGGR